jgi:DNA invertase Pin-like site-specific DNA recombinase
MTNGAPSENGSARMAGANQRPDFQKLLEELEAKQR